MINSTEQRPLVRKADRAWTLSLKTGRKVHTLRLNPWIGIPMGVGLCAFMTAYLAATAYLVSRDDLLNSATSRRLALQNEYEGRIAILRSELDRVASRALVETQNVGSQVASFLERQESLYRRQSVLDELIAQARASGIVIAETSAPIPRPRPDIAGRNASPDLHALGYAGEKPGTSVITEKLIRQNASGAAAGPAAVQGLRPALREVESSLDSMQSTQSSALDVLLRASEAEAARLSKALEPIGLELPSATGSGGPFIPPAAHFVEKTATLQRRLDELAAIRRQADAMPLRSPVAGAATSSHFGSRIDPFLGKPAFHGGIDFVAAEGTEIRAPAPGTVTAAGWSGGYGKRIEIRHADGVVTRFAHLSSIDVRKGGKVVTGQVIGRVGSTGRSTGAHLHYETRKNGKPVDPATYLRVGRML